ncbi:hypothetical protein L1987_49997 [Smallanthus sonchifolius]|uniref:Uncharacterized protein n=1 Tax=Smallanthus sonchifolius TaxID=185202 RepID=A0ACB9FX97_9ASTR|nr:hypothetical protein L1987_49997 [Smallanthus sonchifolius]
MSLVTKAIRESASEIYHGDAICQEKSKFLLTEMGLPNGLLPLEDIVECGYVKDTGFVWLIQKKEKKHKFEKIGKLTSYATEVTAIIEKFKIKKLTGVKTKELLMWVTLGEISVDNPPTGKITFKATSGLYRSFPVSAFQIDDVKKDVGGVSVAKDSQVKEVNMKHGALTMPYMKRFPGKEMSAKEAHHQKSNHDRGRGLQDASLGSIG